MKSEQDMVTMDRITLEKIQFNIQQMISLALLNEMRFESVEDITAQFFIQRLTFYLWGNKVHHQEVDSQVRVYPATMWEELKRDFWPEWLKRRFPVRYSRDITHVTHNHYHICPHLNYKGDRKHLDFLMLNDAGQPNRE